MSDIRPITLNVNGVEQTVHVPPRMTLADCLRDEIGLTGTHLGCEHGVCGACTILMDGSSARSCLILAVQAEGHAVVTIEGLSSENGDLHPLQAAFAEKHGLQCGFCTPGMILSACELIQENSDPSQTEMSEQLSGNLCRCTGYTKIFESVTAAAEVMRNSDPVAVGNHENGAVQ